MLWAATADVCLVETFRKTRIAIVLLLVAPTLLAAPLTDPAYNGKALSQWLLELDTPPSSEELRGAISDGQSAFEAIYRKKTQRDGDAIRKIGTNGLPVLLAIIGAKTNNVRQVMAQLKEKNFQDLLRDEEPELDNFRKIAVAGFEALGPVAQPAIPQLTKLLYDWETGVQVARALRKIGPSGVAVLTNAISSTDATVRGNIVWAIRDEQEKLYPELVTGVLIPSLKDPEWSIRGNAAGALAGQDPAVAIPLLVELMDDPMYYPRSEAVTALGSFGPAAKVASAKMLQMYTTVVGGPDKDLARNLGVGLKEALKKIDPEAAEKAEAFLVNSSPVSAARNGHTMTTLRDGSVLAVGGYIHTSKTNEFVLRVDLQDPRTKTWSHAGQLNSPRSSHSTTLLRDGTVLVAGGNGPGGAALASAELYDPATRKWTFTARMNTACFDHRAALQPDGKVMIAGGHTGRDRLLDTELYDPNLRVWSRGPAMTNVVPAARAGHTATVLPDGKVLILGGSEHASPELYDPIRDRWTNAVPTITPRSWHRAALLADGRLLVAGGSHDRIYLSGSEIYDPRLNEWTKAGESGVASIGETLTLLRNGKVLVAGGETGDRHLARAELFDPATTKWKETGTLKTKRAHHAATLLSNGKVLVMGGKASRFEVLHTAELYDAASGKWKETKPMRFQRWRHTATLLPNGKVLVAGGSGPSFSALNNAELYDPTTEEWQETGPLNMERYDHTATLLWDMGVLVIGSAQESGGAPLSAEIYDPKRGTWIMSRMLKAERAHHTATVLPNGKVLIVGGDVVSPFELYEPAALK